MQRPARLRASRPAAAFALAPVLAILVVLGAAEDASAASRYPTVSPGNRGSDVRALQELLLHHGRDAAVTGYFDVRTRAAVEAFQAGRGLPASGIVESATWRALTPRLERGSRGHGVRAAQRLLNEKRRAGLTVDGIFGAATRRAVAAFQEHMGVKVSGVMTESTWRRLVWHYERPVWRNGLCDYSVGNGPANWGTGAAIGGLEAAARRVAEAGYGRVAVGDVSLEHGGDIRGHETHELGLDVDLRPMRDDRDQCRSGTDHRLASYNRKATRALVEAVRAAAPGYVRLIYFNDPILVAEGLTTRHPGHDNHLHVRYCEAAHPVTAYRCPSTAAAMGRPARPAWRASPW